MNHTVVLLAGVACVVYGRRVNIVEESSQFGRHSNDPHEVGLARKLYPLQELLMNQETAELPAAFFGNIIPQRPRTLEEATTQLEYEREKNSQLREDLKVAAREVGKVAPLSRELDLSKSKNDEFKSQLADMRKAVEEGKRTKDMLSKAETALETTKQTLQIVLAEGEENKEKLQQLSELKVKIQEGENVLASELALAQAEIQRLRAKENELNVKLQIQGRRLAGIRDKALKSMGNLSLSPTGLEAVQSMGNLSLSLPASEAADEMYLANKQVALEALIQEAKESTSTNAILLGQTEQQLGMTIQTLGELEQKVIEGEAEILAATEAGANITKQLQAQTQKADAVEKVSADLKTQLQKTQSELRKAKASIEEQKRAEKKNAKEQANMAEEFRQTLSGKEDELFQVRARLQDAQVRLEEARKPRGIRRLAGRVRRVFLR